MSMVPSPIQAVSTAVVILMANVEHQRTLRVNTLLDGKYHLIRNGKADFGFTGIFNDYRGTTHYAYHIKNGVMYDKKVIK